jgi:hypothetical protein
MPGKKQLSRRKRPIKSLLDDIILPKKKKSKTTAVAQELAEKEDTPIHSSSDVISCSSSVLKGYEEVKKHENDGRGSGTSPNPTLQQGQLQSDQVRKLLICYTHD